MKIQTPKKETIQYAFDHSPLVLTNAQLFFLENYLRKQKRSLMIFHSSNAAAGKLTITITRFESGKKIQFVLKKVMTYILAFQGIEPSMLSARSIKIQRISCHVDPIKIATSLPQFKPR